MADTSKRILVVDDEPMNINLLVELLKPDYRLLVAKNGPQALQRVQGEVLPDLILLDVMMPDMDGYEVCRQLKSHPRTQHIPVIFVTAMSADEDETKGFQLGAVDYVTKPISPCVVRARVRTHLELHETRQILENQNIVLEEKVKERTQELLKVQAVTIRAMASLAETRDNETGNHIRRTQYYVKALAEYLSQQPKFAEALTPETIELLFKSAPLHDIGKVGIPDHILLKPGRLTEDEFAIMKLHAVYGRDAILAAEQELGEDKPSSFLRFAREIAYGHHEKWDGSGYPQGLAREAIPVSARLMAVADVYDALISKRVYKAPFSHEEACRLICEGRGSHFDPDMVDAFVTLQETFREIATKYADSD